MTGPLRLRIRLTPRGGGDRIEGWTESAGGARLLKVRVAPPPVEGAANDALVRLLARALGVPRSAVAIVHGESSRIKTIEIASGDADLAARIEGLAKGR